MEVVTTAKAEKLLPEKLDPLEIVALQLGKLQRRVDRLERILALLAADLRELEEE